MYIGTSVMNYIFTVEWFNLLLKKNNAAYKAIASYYCLSLLYKPNP